MTNLEIIKHIANTDPARLAEFLTDIYCNAWNCGSFAASTGKDLANCEIADFNQWIYQDAAESGYYYDTELEKWSKEIKKVPHIKMYIDGHPSLELELKDGKYVFTNHNFNVIDQAIDQIKLLEDLIKEYPGYVYKKFRKKVCSECRMRCMKAQMDILRCPKFEHYIETLEELQ